MNLHDNEAAAARAELETDCTQPECAKKDEWSRGCHLCYRGKTLTPLGRALLTLVRDRLTVANGKLDIDWVKGSAGYGYTETLGDR